MVWWPLRSFQASMPFLGSGPHTHFSRRVQEESRRMLPFPLRRLPEAQYKVFCIYSIGHSSWKAGICSCLPQVKLGFCQEKRETRLYGRQINSLYHFTTTESNQKSILQDFSFFIFQWECPLLSFVSLSFSYFCFSYNSILNRSFQKLLTLSQ